jgi:hypothetical protein
MRRDETADWRKAKVLNLRMSPFAQARQVLFQPRHLSSSRAFLAP